MTREGGEAQTISIFGHGNGEQGCRQIDSKPQSALVFHFDR